MKITIEMPGPMARQVKILAVERKTTLRELVLQGLDKILNEKPLNSKERSERLFAAMDKLSGFSASLRLSRDEAHINPSHAD